MRRMGKWMMAPFVFLLVMMLPRFALTAAASSDPMIVVSLGDSYSSGEGVEPFYGQDLPLSQRVYDQDWLAHRSTKGWPALLEVPGYPGTMKDHRQTGTSDAACQWYFNAVSGAVTSNVYLTAQNKKTNKSDGRHIYQTSVDLPRQIAIFDQINGNVDYVTMTIGGNDVGFVDIIRQCVLGSTYLNTSKLDDMMADIWADMDYTKLCLKNAYKAIEGKAGPQAAIIVAGYPKLLKKTGKGPAISREEAETVNRNVSEFNDVIETLVSSCRNDGMNIHFVSVEEAFDADGGHQVYSDNAWINGIIPMSKSQDLNAADIISAYSVHPNELGVQVYAKCVNEKIAEIENSKKIGTLSGMVCMASNRFTPIPAATISIYDSNGNYAYRAIADANGNYSVAMNEGEYFVVVDSLGYIPFTAYATVVEDQNTYMETFLLIAGQEGEQGTAGGKVTNAMTGNGVAGANISVRVGWNNSDKGDVIAVSQTDAHGNYFLTLPLGNYTLTVCKEGYITGTVNIIVLQGITSYQNGSISPVITGDDYRIVLTWGQNPRDLDSHVSGTLSNGCGFHVYYAHKSQFDGENEICNLDVDDTSSYGPETITLKTPESTPYYYYVHHFAGSGNIPASEAIIKVYQGSELVAKINVPTDQGSGLYWNVFAIVDGELILKNTITPTPDTSYANSTASTFSMSRVAADSEEVTAAEADDETAEESAGEVADADGTAEEAANESAEEGETAEEPAGEEETAEESAEEPVGEEETAEESAEETAGEEETVEESVGEPGDCRDS